MQYFFCNFQIIDEEKKCRSTHIDSSNIDSSTTTSTSFESIKHCQETSSSNSYTSWTESSTENSKSQFTQIENQKKIDEVIQRSSDGPLVFNAQIVFFEKPSDNCLTRSLSEEPNSSQGTEKLKGKLYQF